MSRDHNESNLNKEELAIEKNSLIEKIKEIEREILEFQNKLCSNISEEAVLLKYTEVVNNLYKERRGLYKRYDYLLSLEGLIRY